MMCYTTKLHHQVLSVTQNKAKRRAELEAVQVAPGPETVPLVELSNSKEGP